MISETWAYLKAQVTDSADTDDDASLARKNHEIQRERLGNFFAVPMELEQLMAFGFVVCLDAFLAVFTVLPVRLLLATCSAFRWGGPRLKDSHRCDLLSVALIVACCYLLMYLDPSRLYHSIRGQAVIKLYVIFNVLEIGDRLCCSFGQDILDSLFSVIESNGTQQRYLRQLSHFILALCYVCAHTLVLFYQVITLNVSINSHNNALLTLLISNQFVEIKGSVFKKFEKENLFQLSCSDMVERFQLSVFLMIITMRNLAELGVDRLSEMLQNFDMSMLYSQLISLPTELSHLFLETVPDTFYSAVTTPFTWTLDVGTYMGLFDALIYPALIVFGTEIIVDWLKHAFITKFNQIRPSVYARYLDILCKDVVFGRHATATMDALPPVPQNNLNMSDHSAVVARRIGFASIPLACLVIRVVLQTSASLVPTCDIYSSTFLSGIGCLFNITLLICAVYTILLIAKCVCGITLIRYSKRRYAAMRIRANQQKFEASLAKKVQQKKDSTHIKSIAEASFVSLPTSPMSLHSFMAGEKEVNELMPLEIPMLDSDLVLPALSTPTHSRVSALTIQSRSRGNSDVVDTERYGGGAADKSQQRQATSNISSRRTSVLPVEVMLMREKADDEFKVQIPQNDGRLAKDEQDLIGSIKISNAEGPASLETIDRYTLFKGRIP